MDIHSVILAGGQTEQSRAPRHGGPSLVFDTLLREARDRFDDPDPGSDPLDEPKEVAPPAPDDDRPIEPRDPDDSHDDDLAEDRPAPRNQGTGDDLPDAARDRPSERDARAAPDTPSPPQPAPEGIATRSNGTPAPSADRPAAPTQSDLTARGAAAGAVATGARPQNLEPGDTTRAAGPMRTAAVRSVVPATVPRVSALPQGIPGEQPMPAAVDAATPQANRSARPSADAASRATTKPKISAGRTTAEQAQSGAAARGGPERALKAVGTTPARALGLFALTGAESSGQAAGQAASTIGSAAPGLVQTATGATGPAPAAARPAGVAAGATGQIAVQINKAVQAGQDRINIKLHPAELGRIEVRLEWAEDGLLRAMISVERSETLDLLERDARALERALKEAGLQTDSGTLSFDLRGGASHGENRDDEAPAGLETDAPGNQATEADDGALGSAGRRAIHHGLLDLTV